MRSTWHDGLVDAFPDHRNSDLKTVISPEAKPDFQQLQGSALLSNNKPSCHFFSLPPELRDEIYFLVLFSRSKHGETNNKLQGGRLHILLANKQFYSEASHILYRTSIFRIFPIQDFTPQKSIKDIPLQYRTFVTNLEMIVGSSWTNPPKSWRVTRSLTKCLAKMTSVRTLHMFVEVDPSHPIFAKYRISFDFYTNFCGNLLKEVLVAAPQLKIVELDGNPGVDMKGELVTRLRKEAEIQGKTIQWGKHHQWTHKISDLPSINPA